jgi:hypothetical protein
MLFLAPALFSQNAGERAVSGFKTDGVEFGGLFRVPDFEKPALVLLADSAAGNNSGGSLMLNNSPSSMPPASFWLKDLRRAEIVAFGSLPLTIFWTSFVMDMYRCAVHGWDNRYAPWPFKGAGAVAMDGAEVKMMFTFAISSSLAIALIDHIIVRVKRAKVQRAAAASAPVIKREPESAAGPEYPPED